MKTEAVRASRLRHCRRQSLRVWENFGARPGQLAKLRPVRRRTRTACLPELTSFLPTLQMDAAVRCHRAALRDCHPAAALPAVLGRTRCLARFVCLPLQKRNQASLGSSTESHLAPQGYSLGSCPTAFQMSAATYRILRCVQSGLRWGPGAVANWRTGRRKVQNRRRNFLAAARNSAAN
jgi:hypothetical protein